ncbi:30S ribosomal protein S6 [Striga asiatica]|uniref:30S ribosomal protein S6 n=1 Tax=Striga asiatica TaxID=4170 RepID=A0A5A7PAU5_STRAF|nr:30S ribosomal protein S6 [Striga asiatica]
MSLLIKPIIEDPETDFAPFKIDDFSLLPRKVKKRYYIIEDPTIYINHTTIGVRIEESAVCEEEKWQTKAMKYPTTPMNIAQDLSLNRLENQMLVKDALIRRLVLLLRKDPTQYET